MEGAAKDVKRERLGPLVSRYVERDISPFVGVTHRLDDVLAFPALAGWLRHYTWSNEPTERRGCLDEASGALSRDPGVSVVTRQVGADLTVTMASFLPDGSGKKNASREKQVNPRKIRFGEQHE